MSETQIIIQTIDFPLEPWKVAGPNLEQIWPVKGTWTLAPDKFLREGVKGFVGCPRCQYATMLKPDSGVVTNGVCEIKQMSCPECGFLCNARLLAWDTNKLFCIAYERLDENGISIAFDDGEFIRKEYTHAPDRNTAFFCFVEVRKQYAGRFKVVDCGEVIGFWGKESDKDQVELTV